MHSPSHERNVFRFLIGLSIFSVIGFFNNCSGQYVVPNQSAEQVEMSSTHIDEDSDLKDVTRNSQPE